MAIYTTDVDLGVTTGAAFAGEVDVYIEGNSASGVGNSLTDVTAVTTGNVAQLTQNNASMTGRNMTYLCTNLFNSTTGSSSPVVFENSSIHTVTSGSNWWFPLTLTNVDIYNTSTTSGNTGIYGDGSGTAYPTFDADGHIVTNGNGHKARSRPWNLTNVRIFGSGGLEFLLNGALPGASTFTNVDFNPAPGRGAFGELPFLAFADATWGQFYRQFPLTTDNLWCRLTGGMDRADLSITDNWMIQPQWNIVNLDGETAQIGIDGNVFAYFVNMALPDNTNNLTMRGAQGNSLGTPGRGINCYGWNPLINGGTNDIKYEWDNTVYNIHSVPATFTGGDITGAAVLPTVITPGFEEPADFNGFFIIQNDTGSIANTALAGATVITAYNPRDIHLFSYDTQVNTLDGTTFNANVGRSITLTPTAHAINADLTWRAQEVIDEPVDVFLNGRTLAQGDPTVEITSLEHVYPTLKAFAYNNPNRSDQRFRIVPFEGGLRFLDGSILSTTLDTQITNAGLLIISLQEANTGVGLVSSLDFRDENNANVAVNWQSTARTFDAAITLTGGTHTNFPENWANGLTLMESPTLSRPTAGTTLDYSNVNIPDGTTVTFAGTDAFSISGLTAAEQARIVNTDSSITFIAAPILNTLRIPAQSGKFAVRVRDGSDTEAVAPRRFTPTEIAAGMVEFVLSNQTSPDGSAFSNLVSGDMVDVYVKYDSTVSATATNVVYQESLQTLPYDIDTPNAIQNVTVPLPLTNVLVGNAVPTPNGVGFVGSQTTQNRALFLVSGANSDNVNVPGGELTNFQSQGLAIEIANDQEYFNSWYNNRGTTTTPIAIYPVSAAEWDPSRIIFGSGNTEPFTQGSQTVNIPVQQRGADWSVQADTTGTLYLRGAGVDELSFPASLQASLNTVVNAASVGIDNSATAARVQNAERGVGYLVSNGNATTPATTDSRLVGIKPKNANYSDTVSYEDIL